MNDDTAKPEDSKPAPEAEVNAAAAPEVAGPDPVEVLRAENAELRDRVLRSAAEMENLRKRTEREVSDTRSPAQVAQMLKHKGLEPVWKDWDRAFTIDN